MCDLVILIKDYNHMYNILLEYKGTKAGEFAYGGAVVSV